MPRVAFLCTFVVKATIAHLLTEWKCQLRWGKLSSALCKKNWEFVPTSFIDETPPQLIYAVGLSTHLWELDSSNNNNNLGSQRILPSGWDKIPTHFADRVWRFRFLKINFWGLNCFQTAQWWLSLKTIKNGEIFSSVPGRTWGCNHYSLKGLPDLNYTSPNPFCKPNKNQFGRADKSISESRQIVHLY